MRFQNLVFRTIPEQLVEWFDGELEKRGIDSAYTHCILSILQEDHHDTELDECVEVKNHQMKVIKKYGGPESLYSAAKPKYQKWKTYDKQILLSASAPCCDVSISDLERKKRNAAVSCLKSVSDDVTIDGLIDELCSRLKSAKSVNDRKDRNHSVKSYDSDKEMPFYIPPSSPTDQVEKYFAAFPPLEKQHEGKCDLNVSLNSNVWSGSYISTNKILEKNTLQKNNVKYFENREKFKNVTNSYGSLKSIENIYVPNSSVTENITKKTVPANKYGNNFQIEFCDENTCNFSNMRKSGTKLHNPLTCGVNSNKANELDSLTNSENICDVVISTAKSAFEKPKPCQTLNNAYSRYSSHKAELNSAQKIKILSSSTYQLVTSRNRVNENSNLRSISSANLFMPIKERISLNPMINSANNTEKLEINGAEESENFVNSTDKSFKCPAEKCVLQYKNKFEEMKNLCANNNLIVLKIDNICGGRDKITFNKITSSSPSSPQKQFIPRCFENANYGCESNFVLDVIKKEKSVKCMSVIGFKRIHTPYFMKITLNVPRDFSKFIYHNIEEIFLLSMCEKIPCDASKSIMKIIEVIQYLKQIKLKSEISCCEYFSAIFVLKKSDGSYKIDKTSVTVKIKKSRNVFKDKSKTRSKISKTGSSNKYCSISLYISKKWNSVDFPVKKELSSACDEDISYVNFSPYKFKTIPGNSFEIFPKHMSSWLPAKIFKKQQPYDDSNNCVKCVQSSEVFNSKEKNETLKMEYLYSSEIFPSNFKQSDNLKEGENIPSVSIFSNPSITTPYFKHKYANDKASNINEEIMFIDSEEYYDLETLLYAPNISKCLCTNSEKKLLFQGKCETGSINFCIYSNERIEDNNSRPNFELPMSLKHLATLPLIFNLNLVNILKISNFNLDHHFYKSNLNENDMFQILTTGSLIDVNYLINLFSSLGYFNHNLSLNVSMNINDGEINDLILSNKKTFVPKYCMRQCIINSSIGSKSGCELKFLYSSKLFLSSSELLNDLKKIKVVASFSVPSYPLITTSYHLMLKDTNHTKNDSNVEMFFINGLPHNNAPIRHQHSGKFTELPVPWPIVSNLAVTKNIALDKSHEPYFSCESFAQKEPLVPENPAAQVFSWKYPSFTDTYVQKHDVGLNILSGDLKSSNYDIHEDSFHDENTNNSFNSSHSLIDNQNIHYFTNPFCMDVESKIGKIFLSNSEDIKNSDNFGASLHDDEFSKLCLYPSNNTETENFASNPILPLCIPSAFKPYKRFKNKMPKKGNFTSSGQKLLKKVINIDQLIKKIADKDKVAFFETISTFSKPDEIDSNMPFTLEQTSYPSYSGAKNKKLNSENPLWSVDSINPISSWPSEYSLKSIWSDNRNSANSVWKNVAKTLKNNELSDPYAICNDTQNEDDLLRGLFSLPDLKVEDNLAHENDIYIQSCESYIVNSEQSIDISNLSTHNVLASSQAVSNISTNNSHIYSLSVPHNDPVGFFCLDNCKSDDTQTEIDCLDAGYSVNEDAQAYQALDFADLSAFRGPYGSYNEYGINYIEGGGWSLDSDSYMFESVTSQGNSFLQEMNPELNNENLENVQQDMMEGSVVHEEIAKYASKKSHAKPPSRRPCLFYMEGNCIHHHCRYNHDLSNTTCRFWIRGSCFKGATCPFFHGYSRRKVVDQHQIVNESEPESIYSLDSEADFPSLSSSKSEMRISKSEPVNIKHIKVSKNLGQKSH